MAETSLSRILEKVTSRNQLSGDEIIYLLQLEGDDLKQLLNQADRVRARMLGNKIHLRGIIEFSNNCRRNCKYCGLRQDNLALPRYSLAAEEIVAMAGQGVKLGYRTIVLQSGEDYYDAEKIAWIIREIKGQTDSAITLCLGERDYQEYKLWRAMGADRYLLKMETADPDLYHNLHPEMDYQQRLERLAWLKELGYQVGSGNIIGLPGQTEETIVQDLLLFKELDLEMVGIGPFIAHPGTPLADFKNGSVAMTLKTVAITRLLLPLSHLPATTALGSIDRQGRQQALRAGANVVMPNITAAEYRSFYQIYPAKICINEQAVDCRRCIGGIIASLGREVAVDCGHSPKMV